MDLINIVTEPSILLITLVFLFFLLSVTISYQKIEKNLKSVYNFLSTFNKNELSYRFAEFNTFLASNPFTDICWEDCKKALIFPEKLYTTVKQSAVSVSSASEVYLTVDASYFFNEDTLINTKINYKFIQAMPTLLTGLGPFFTFFKMAIAFSVLDLSAADALASLNGLIHNIQIAALCSVFAVGYSLLFLFYEKILYNRKCKHYELLIQKEFIRLFDICTSEQFLLDLVKESKIQGVSTENILKSLPEDFAKLLTKSLGDLTTPYLENILFSLNKLNEAVNKSSGNGDVVDKLF